MATTQHEIYSYLVYHMTDNFGQSTIIRCYDSGSAKGSLYFYKEGITIPDSSKSSSGHLNLRFHEKHLTDVLETLRQEKPLYIWLNDDFAPIGGLKTSSEPIGEEES